MTVLFATLSLLGGVGRQALASAWNRPAGQGLVIVDASFEGGEKSFDATGRLVAAQRYAKSEASSYIEYGLTDQVMLVARPSFVATRLGQPGGDSSAGFGGIDAGIQRQLLFDPTALALQGTIHLPGTTSHGNPADIGNTAYEADVRALGGVDFKIGPLPAFIELQGSLRLRSAGAASQWHGNATFGFRPIPSLLILVQSFTSIPRGEGSAWFPSARYTQGELNAVYQLSEAWAVHVGLVSTITGRNALRERGVKAGLWYSF